MLECKIWSKIDVRYIYIALLVGSKYKSEIAMVL